MVPFKCKLGHCPLAYLVLVDHAVVDSIWHVVANTCQREKRHEILEGNEKTSVVLVLTIHLLAGLKRPFLRFVTPIASPFFFPVRISDFN